MSACEDACFPGGEGVVRCLQATAAETWRGAALDVHE